MIGAALGLTPQRGDQINVISMPFMEEEVAVVADSTIDAESLYQYLPFIKIGLVSLGALLLYFLLVRPVIKTMKGEVTEHYKTVDELEREEAARIAAEEKAQLEPPPLSVEDDIGTIRKEVMQNQVPAAYIVKNWIQEG